MNTAIESSKVYHFVNDTSFLYSCKNIINLRKTMNKDLNILYKLLCANRLSLNVGKTEFIIFRPGSRQSQPSITLRLCNRTLFESSKIKNLGLILDDRLNWKLHIAELTKKLS